MKKKDDPIVKLRKVGIVHNDYSSVERAGNYWRSSYRWIPLVSIWIKISCTVALLGALACLVIVFTRPRPVLLVSFPDGLTLCSMPPLDPKTGRAIPRPSGEAELCAQLSTRAGRGTDEQNLAFAKQVQKEAAVENMAPISDHATGIATPAVLSPLAPPHEVLSPTPLSNDLTVFPPENTGGV